MNTEMRGKKAFYYEEFLTAIKNRVQTARINFSRQANSLYWFIGKVIVESQERRGWGKSVVKNLSNDLRKLFPIEVR